MRLHMPSAGYRTASFRHYGHTPAPYAYRRLRAFATLSMARSVSRKFGLCVAMDKANGNQVDAHRKATRI